jgi:nitrous oxide reductase accessory protein NosL
MKPVATFALIMVLLNSASCAKKDKAAETAAIGRCPVCGMSVEEYPNFLCQLRLKDGSTLSFDGPKDMFSFYHNPGKYRPSSKTADIVSVSVSDYYSLERVDGQQAYFVIGSNVMGPMGKELIAFQKEADAREFVVDHAGKSILMFKEVTAEILKELE